ncbi:hypothetical protein PR202_ga25841 [Eleusine coracana subsp. coracana]|uniref:Ribosome biogenesis protein BMS1/TSR1 C-terminal domain-containing protein n=1 Tax=Eleusine coracana subsp. coracana TaxID=191504 RepID=A0AAV5DCX5_ELECO|nr:hypothetical protein PR202_ga25841 [Eleusine coracana subsp. coracana]
MHQCLVLGIYLAYDKDAVYININDHLVQFSKNDDNDAPKKQGKGNDVGVTLSIESKLEDNVISASQQDKKDANFRNTGTMESNGQSECSSDSEEDNDDATQISDRDVDLREEVEFHDGRLRRRVVSTNFQKIELTGEPCKIFKKTALIKGMFTSALEVARFEGAAISTVAHLVARISTPSALDGGGPIQRRAARFGEEGGCSGARFVSRRLIPAAGPQSRGGDGSAARPCDGARDPDRPSSGDSDPGDTAGKGPVVELEWERRPLREKEQTLPI